MDEAEQAKRKLEAAEEMRKKALEAEAEAKAKAAERSADEPAAPPPAPADDAPAVGGSSKFSQIKMEDLSIITTLGKGTYGEVKLVKHEPTAEVMAIKVQKKVSIIEFNQQAQVVRESKVYKKMCSKDFPLISQLHGTFQDSDHLYMLMELCQGGELYGMLYETDELTGGDGGMTVEAVRFYVACTILMFEYLHIDCQVAYRDLKLENLVLAVNGYPKLIDMGFALELSDGQFTHTRCGSPDYMSPEQHAGNPHDRRVDLWALGAMAFELLVGKTPFQDKNPIRMAKKVQNEDPAWPEGFDGESPEAADAFDFVNKLLVKDPTARLGVTTEGSGLDYKAIKAHPFFAGVDWEALLAGTVAPPYVPELENPEDVSYFEEFSDDEEDDHMALEDDGSGWADEF
jgi:serine/threonine protein kinase